MIHALIIFLEIRIIIDLVVLYDDVFGLHIFNHPGEPHV